MTEPLTLSSPVVMFSGDWHGNFVQARTMVEKAAAAGVDTIYHVGDLGIGRWPGETQTFTSRLERKLEQANVMVYVTPGNHENYDDLEACPVDESGLYVVEPHIRAFPRGYRWTHAGRRFGSMGGAVSVDAYYRVAGKSWWERELPTSEELARLGDMPLDILITHEVPDGVPVRGGGLTIPPELLESANQFRRDLASIVYATHPRHVFCGHWHQRLSFELPTPNGPASNVHVLDMDGRRLNSVLVDLNGSMEPQPLYRD